MTRDLDNLNLSQMNAYLHVTRYSPSLFTEKRNFLIICLLASCWSLYVGLKDPDLKRYGHEIFGNSLSYIK
jgi:hypothetical protein